MGDGKVRRWLARLTSEQLLELRRRITDAPTAADVLHVLEDYIQAQPPSRRKRTAVASTLSGAAVPAAASPASSR